LSYSISTSKFSLLDSCASAPTQEVEKQVINYSIALDKGIVILPTTVTFEAINKNIDATNKKANATDVSRWMSRIAMEVINNIGLNTHLADSLNIHTSTKTTAFEEFSNNLVFEKIRVQDLNDFVKNLCEQYIGDAILIQNLKVKVGSEAEWESVSALPFFIGFVPKVNMSSSYLRTIIRDCHSTDILWQNEVFIRALPNIKNLDFEQKIRQVYENLHTERDKHDKLNVEHDIE